MADRKLERKVRRWLQDGLLRRTYLELLDTPAQNGSDFLWLALAKSAAGLCDPRFGMDPAEMVRRSCGALALVSEEGHQDPVWDQVMLDVLNWTSEDEKNVYGGGKQRLEQAKASLPPGLTMRTALE